jgi:hypothetical protein
MRRQHRNARYGINLHREKWAAHYDVKSGRVIGELWDPHTNSKDHDFNVKLADDRTFKVSVGTSGDKIVFKH